MTPLLQVEHISKSFPGVNALQDVSFTLNPGSVHVLCGENGAGKSTLVKIINGVYQPDTGIMRISGQETAINHPVEAKRHKISMIFQELDYVPDFTVEQSLVLGEEPVNRLGKINWKQVRRETLRLLEQEELPYKPTTKLKDLTVSDIQMLEILKAVSMDAKIILMDEPTSAITDKEIDRLFEKIHSLRNKGVGIIYISHKLDEIFKIADEISVLRDGKLVETKSAHELNKDQVISLMVGRTLDHVFPDPIDKKIGEPILEISGLTQLPRFKDVSLHVRRGEIVGLAGLVGAGRTEIARAVFGLDPYQKGTIKLHGKEVPVKHVQDSIKNGVAMLSEDRKRYGLILSRNVMENTTLTVLDSYFQRGWNQAKKEREAVQNICRKMNVKTPSLFTLTGTLSGGNQQKVVIAKWLLKNQDILILDEPTRGIDVGAKFEIYKLMMELAAQNKAVLMISSELPELIGVCDRIYVMARGYIAKELKKDEFDQETIMKYATKGMEL